MNLLKKVFDLKRSRKRTTKWNIFFHYTTILFNIIIGIVLVPLYLKFIPADTYGYWLATGNILAWLTIIDPGFSAVVQQKVAYYYGSKELSRVGQYAFSGFSIITVFIIIILLGGVYVSYNFTDWLGIKDFVQAQSLVSAFNYALIGTGFMLFSFILVSVNQGLQSSLGIGIIYFFVQLTSIILLVFLLKNNYGVVSLGIGVLWRGILSVVGNTFYIMYRFKSEKIKLGFDKATYKDFVSLISFNFLGKIGGTISNNLNSFLIAKYLSPTDVTILRITQSTPEMSKLLLVRPSMAITPSLTHLIGEGQLGKAREILKKYIVILIWSIGLFTLGFLSLNEKFINLWVGPKFYGGVTLNFLIILFMFITSITYSFSNLLFALGNIKMNSIIIFFESLFYLFLLFFGIKYLGLIGVLAAAIIAEIIFALNYFPRKLFKEINLTPEDKKNINVELFKVIFAVLIIYSAFYLIQSYIVTWIEFIFSALVIVLFYLSTLLIISSSFKKEFSTALKRIKKIINNSNKQSNTRTW